MKRRYRLIALICILCLLGGCGDPGHIEFEPIEFPCVHAVVEGLAHVERIGSGDDVGVVVKRVGDSVEQFVFRFGVSLRELRLRVAGSITHDAYRFERVGVDGIGLMLWIRHSFLE